MDGEIIRVNGRAHYITCCDCGLVHLLIFRIVKGKIQIKAYRDVKATRKERLLVRKLRKLKKHKNLIL
jgi:hypothetical protein